MLLYTLFKLTHDVIVVSASAFRRALRLGALRFETFRCFPPLLPQLAQLFELF